MINGESTVGKGDFQRVYNLIRGWVTGEDKQTEARPPVFNHLQQKPLTSLIKFENSTMTQNKHSTEANAEGVRGDISVFSD